MVSGETIPVLKKALVQLTSGWCPLTVGCSSPRSPVSSSWGCMSFVPTFGVPCAAIEQWRIPLWCPRVWPCSSTYVKRSNGVVSTWCSRIMTAHCVGLLEAENSLAGPCLRVAHQAGSCSVRIPVQPWREVPVKMARNHWSQKHTMRGAPPAGPWQVKCTAPRMEQLDNKNARLNLQRVKARWCPKQSKWKDKYQSQCDFWYHSWEQS
jgi:hypothetical protein